MSNVIQGLRTAAGLLLGIFTVGIIFLGAEILFAPDGKRLEFNDPTAARVLAALAFISAAALVTFTVRRWVKWLPGLLLVFALRSAMMAAKGHLLSNPEIPVDRLEITIITGLLLFSCYVSTKLWDLEISWAERVQLLAYVACLIWAWVTRSALLPLGIGSLLLLAVWLRHRRA